MILTLLISDTVISEIIKGIVTLIIGGVLPIMILTITNKINKKIEHQEVKLDLYHDQVNGKVSKLLDAKDGEMNARVEAATLKGAAESQAKVVAEILKSNAEGKAAIVAATLKGAAENQAKVVAEILKANAEGKAAIVAATLKGAAEK